MTGARRDRNIKVPTRSKKSETSSTPSTGWSRPAEGRKPVVQPQKKQAPKPAAVRTNRERSTSPSRSNQNRQRGNPRGQRNQTKSPLMEEQWARVIDHDQNSNVVIAITESKMILCRLQPKQGISPLLTTARVYIGSDVTLRTEIENVLGMTNLGRVANHVAADLPLVIQIFIEENEKHFINGFFNVAGNLSLKQHAFELLAGVGNKKALQMVDARGSGGFESLVALSESCNIAAAELLAKRFITELEDRNIQPRLIELLLPVKA